MELIGTVSSEGGAVVITDLTEWRMWRGGDDTDSATYQRVMGLTSIPGLGGSLHGHHSDLVLFDFGPDLAGVFRFDVDRIIVTNSATDLEHLPAEPASRVELGTVECTSGWLVVCWVWASEDEDAPIGEPPREGPIDWGVMLHVGLVIRAPAGTYRCTAQRADDQSSWCWIEHQGVRLDNGEHEQG